MKKQKKRNAWDALEHPVVWGFHAKDATSLPIEKSVIPVDFNGADLNAATVGNGGQVDACRSVRRNDYVAYRHQDGKRGVDEIWVGMVDSDQWINKPESIYPEWRSVKWGGAHKQSEFPPGIVDKIAHCCTIAQMCIQEYADSVKRLADMDFAL